jgi:hypothetical protein
MSSFVSDLTLALEAIVDPLPPGERDAFGTQHSTPDYPEQRDPSGLYRPSTTQVPSGSLESSSAQEKEKSGLEEIEEIEEQVESNETVSREQAESDGKT